jgi:hypothetical protein
MGTTSFSSASEWTMGDHALAGDGCATSDVTLQTRAVAPIGSRDCNELASNLDVILEQVVKLRTLAVYLNARSLAIPPGE